MTSLKRLPVRSWFQDNSLLPTSRLMGAVTLGIVFTGAGMVMGYGNLVFFMFYSLLILIAGFDAFSLLLNHGLKLVRESDPFFELDDNNRVDLVVYNPYSYPVRCILRDDFPEGFTVDHREMELTVPPKEMRTIGYTTCPHRRGQHWFTDIHVRFDSRWKFFTRQQRIAAKEEKRVYPRLAEVRKVRSGVYRKQLAMEGPHARQGLGRGTEFSHIREYVPDDEPRWINWHATARRGRLATNVYQPEQGQHVTILIDCGRIMGIKNDHLTRLDRAVEAALAFSAMALERGDQVSLIAFSNGIKRWVPPGKGGAQLQRIIEACFNLEPDFVESSYQTALESFSFYHKRRTLVALFTDASNLTFADELIQQIAVLQRRHLIMTVTMHDPRMTDMEQIRPDTEWDVYRKTVAHVLGREREGRLKQLKRRGVVVLDVPPEQMAASVIQSYIDIKNKSHL
ncbi:DUF58 domain-containing protein [Kroppenstedtia pulmonis]|uniref:DUF58 domain-containing protein n=1 Tax=Kroppenstedtia pulmonis TaxID=1380685 RepID=A0A7D4BFK9_9BACL|nr:DUF58 domain-containing protein [Kroppenstedtia pulmonis]QKG84432.1 DUF58 domain-containing protein [Kroppenstedtia pulmonis]